ncbi:MAG TPA: MarR family transcriptional regulator [Steroidobacteraceae bacterium]|nr:MarR family transcriptional regulator [Steroidobacteraceae bacterium]
METAATLESHLGYWLRLVSNQISATFARALQERALSVAEWVALAQIDAAPGSSCAELSGAMGVTRGAISKVLDKLEGKEWISRTLKPADSRVQVLTLTRRGRRLLPELARIADANDARFLGVLSADERATLRRLLHKVAAAHRINAMPLD